MKNKFLNLILIALAASLLPACNGGTKSSSAAATKTDATKTDGTNTGDVTGNPDFTDFFALLNAGKTLKVTLAQNLLSAAGANTLGVSALQVIGDPARLAGLTTGSATISYTSPSDPGAMAGISAAAILADETVSLFEKNSVIAIQLKSPTVLASFQLSGGSGFLNGLAFGNVGVYPATTTSAVIVPAVNLADFTVAIDDSAAPAIPSLTVSTPQNFGKGSIVGLYTTHPGTGLNLPTASGNITKRVFKFIFSQKLSGDATNRSGVCDIQFTAGSNTITIPGNSISISNAG